jgi:hypothetical protein
VLRILTLLAAAAFIASAADRPRVIVLTDISSLTAGVREPDDGQSMVRFMLFTNEFDVEGLIATSSMGHGHVTRPELIREAVEAYRQVQPNLKLHAPGYPEADKLLAVVKAGYPVAGPKVAATDSVGEGKDTEGSDWIVSVVDKPDARPVWVLIWGGSADLAQALFKVRATRTPEQLSRFIGKLRVHSVYDQDSTGPWIKENFPALYYITRHHGIRGMYRGGDTTLVASEWVETHIRNDHGPLGALYPNYKGGDIWGRVFGIKEGDTPSYLALIPNGLSDPSKPELGGWGGRFVPDGGNKLRLTDANDGDAAQDDRDPRISAVYRWRPDWQNEFAARLDWCVQPKAKANHPPRVAIRGAAQRTVRPGATVKLDASASDPDGNTLKYEWLAYPRVAPDLIVESRGASATVRMPAGASGEIPIVLAVRDSGSPSLTRYARVVLRVSPR